MVRVYWKGWDGTHSLSGERITPSGERRMILENCLSRRQEMPLFPETRGGSASGVNGEEVDTGAGTTGEGSGVVTGEKPAGNGQRCFSDLLKRSV